MSTVQYVNNELYFQYIFHNARIKNDNSQTFTIPYDFCLQLKKILSDKRIIYYN